MSAFPGSTLSFAHFLGRAPKPADATASQKLAKLRAEQALSRKGVAKAVADRAVRRADITQRVAVLLEKPRSIAATKSALTKPRTATTERPAASKPSAHSLSFAHLAPDRIPAYGQDGAEELTAAFTADHTAQVVAQSLAVMAKVRTPTGTDLPAPTGMAAKVLAAAAKARTPTGTGAPPPTGIAARSVAIMAKLRRPPEPPPLPDDPAARAIVLAGRKRRGEI